MNARDNARRVFPERLRERRKKLSMPQTKLAEVVGIRNESIRLYEMEKVMPSGDKLAGIAKALGVSCDWLLGLTERMDGR